MNIILDLDETLIHAHNNPTLGGDFMLRLSGNIYYIKKRPGLSNFLEFIYKEFNTVSYWTAGTAQYAQLILSNILTRGQQLKTVIVYSRTHLEMHPSGGYFKPLNKIFQTHLAKKFNILKSNTIMIDDSGHNFLGNVGNGLIIPAFTGQSNDKSLSQLILVLRGFMAHSIKMGVFTHVLHLQDITG